VLAEVGVLEFEHPTSKPDVISAMSRYFFILRTVPALCAEARNEVHYLPTGDLSGVWTLVRAVPTSTQR
jgi:hypothetical protein